MIIYYGPVAPVHPVMMGVLLIAGVAWVVLRAKETERKNALYQAGNSTAVVSSGSYYKIGCCL